MRFSRPLAVRAAAPARRAVRLLVLPALLILPTQKAAATAGAGEPRELLVLTVAPPLDENRLADALRVYLEGFDVEIERAPAKGSADLRDVLAGLRRSGEGVRALAAVRVAPGAPGQTEIVLADRFTDKALVTSVPRPRRDEDFYRTVALKVQALLRATLAEAPERIGDRPSLLKLTGAAGEVPPAGAAGRLFMETAYAAAAFPGEGLVQQGVAVTAGWRPAPRWELRLGVAALTAFRGEAAGVAMTVGRIPLRLSAQLRWPGRRFELLAGPEVTAALASVDASSATMPVRSGRTILVAAGASAAGRAYVGRAAWIYLRTTALGLLLAERYTALGQPALALSGLETDVDLGVGVDVW